MTLIEWLRAQLDEDERAALAASPGPWAIGFHGHDREDPDDVPVSDALGRAICDSPDDGVRGGHSAADAHHIAAWEPTRVLAEVKAKRAVLALHKPYVNTLGDVQCKFCMDLCHSRSGLGCGNPDAPYPCPTVSLIAQPYAGRDGWQDDWSVIG